MARPFATVLIDTYNHESFIAEAVTSVLAQDFPASESEILVVDDGSTDRTPEIVRQFQPRVRLIRKVNGGQASAFNAGIAEAQGEIVAFLDGDDWWAANKLSRVAEVLAAQPSVGLVGHSITEILLDGRQRVNALREDGRFRADSPSGARILRNRKDLLGTSRMTIRTRVLRQILPVPDALVFEADEYLFTIAAVLSEVVMLAAPLTFYRHHSANLFHTSGDDSVKSHRKLQVLQALAKLLDDALSHHNLDPLARKEIVAAVQAEADHLRLVLDGGRPWETIRTELNLMRLLYADASFSQHLFSYARLLPAAVMPARAYYHWRNQIVKNKLYQRLRQKFFPFPVPRHAHRSEGPAR